MKKKRHHASFSCARIAALAVVLLAAPVFPETAAASPQNGVVSGGKAHITQSGKKLDIHQQSDRAIIDWRKFDIAADEHTQFHQPHSGATILNRIHDTSPSRVMGRLSANGNVVLVNPNGVFFGKGSTVDVNGLLATSADIKNSRFMDGDMRFDIPGRPDATITNEGHITAREAGLVGLVAPRVLNNGVITAPLGKVHLASGDSFTVDLYGNGLLEVALSDAVSTQLVANSGKVDAPGGTISLTAAQGRNVIDSLMPVKGELNAPTVHKRQGRIIISGGKASATLSGRINASGRNAGERGGSITVTADNVHLTRHAWLDASGHSTAPLPSFKPDTIAHAAGGSIRIGGDYAGGGDLATANHLRVDAGATLLNDAIHQGDGGRTILWSDSHTVFHGRLSARGGAKSGNGGFAEVSSKGVLDYRGTADLRATQGQTGNLLLDPYDLFIRDVAADSGLTGSFTSNGNDSVLTVDTLLAALGSANVTVATGGGGGQQGNITVEDALSWANGNRLTLDAHHDIALNADITAPSGALTLLAGNNVTATGGIDVDSFRLESGYWVQNATDLPNFTANRFYVAFDTDTGFLRAAGGNGGTSPYEITDAYGLYGVATHRSLGNLIYAYRGSNADHNGTYFDTAGFRQNDGTNGLGFAENGTRYIVHKYVETGSHTFAPVAGVEEVEYLIIGGGGSSGNRIAGGGGAGGLLQGSLAVDTINYPIVVGEGGAAPTNSNQSTIGNSGEASSAFGLTALGGGRGGVQGASNGAAGGSGGGGRGNNASSGGSGEAGQGNAGAAGGSGRGGGGGGGAGSAGQAGQTPAYHGGDGGNGLQVAITGQALYYAGGGAGGAGDGTGAATGGLGGGGDGGQTSAQPGQDGQANTGGGGGGGGFTGSGNALGGSGGSGITIIRYAAPELTIGGDFTVENKTFDDTTDATIETTNFTPAGVTGLVDVDITQVNASPSFATKEVGSDIVVSLNPTSATLGGANAGFYVLSLDNAITTQANIIAPPRPSSPTKPVPAPSKPDITETPQNNIESASRLPNTFVQVSQNPSEYNNIRRATSSASGHNFSSASQSGGGGEETGDSDSEQDETPEGRQREGRITFLADMLTVHPQVRNMMNGAYNGMFSQ
jgi:filamentous hemagglutinin family protein